LRAGWSAGLPPPAWFRRGSYSQDGLISTREIQRSDEALGGISIWVCRATFQLLDAVLTQPGALGKGLLRQPCGKPILPQQGPKTSGSRH
jgi:hypothetical protein